MIVLQFYFKSKQTNKKNHVNESNSKSKRNRDGVLLNPGCLISQTSLIQEYFLKQHHKGFHVLLFSYQGMFSISNPPFFPPLIIRWLQKTPNQESPPLGAHPPHFMEQYLSCRIFTVSCSPYQGCKNLTQIQDKSP